MDTFNDPADFAVAPDAADFPEALSAWLVSVRRTIADRLQEQVSAGRVPAPASPEEARATVDALTRSALLESREHAPTVWALFAEYVRQNILINR